jgi:hypothetical protein
MGYYFFRYFPLTFLVNWMPSNVSIQNELSGAVVSGPGYGYPKCYTSKSLRGEIGSTTLAYKVV